jgi:hypothetical protein
MAAPVTAAPRRRAAPQISAYVVGAILLIVVSVSLLAFVTLRLSSPDNGETVETYVQGDGYPLHGGLAGPSRVSVFDQHPLVNQGGSFGVGYPLHGGLAGPSRAGTIASSSYGIGYPLRGGLAGPSRRSTFDRPSYPHGGFAGPSRADGDR